MSRPPIDWARVEEIMRKSAHQSLTDDEQRLVLRAFTEDHARYRRLSQRVKGEEIAAYRRAIRGGTDE